MTTFFFFFFSRTYKRIQNYSQQWAHYTCDCFISNTLSWNKKSQNNRLFRDVYVRVLFFYFLWRVTRSAQLPECTVTLNPVTHHINAHTDAQRGGSKPAAALLIDGRLYLWPGAQSAQRRRCLLLLRGNGMSLTWNHKCDVWNADAVITCVVAVFLSVLLGKDYWNNMTAVMFFVHFFSLFFSLSHRHTCSLMERMRSWGKE